jgi:hypothetical protein
MTEAKAALKSCAFVLPFYYVWIFLSLLRQRNRNARVLLYVVGARTFWKNEGAPAPIRKN